MASARDITKKNKEKWLEQSDLSSNRLYQLAGVISHTLFENQSHVRDIGDVGRRISVDHHEVRLLAHRNRANAIRSAEVGRPVQGADLDRLERREATRDEQLCLALAGRGG